MMNERIQELAEQAGLLYPQFGPTVDTRHQRKKRENIEKLIVRECADIADRRPNVLINQTVGGWIKQHFGVES
jgi:hypothetical protein